MTDEKPTREERLEAALLGLVNAIDFNVPPKFQMRGSALYYARQEAAVLLNDKATEDAK